MTHVHTLYADAEMEGVSFRKSISYSDGWVVRIRTTLGDRTPVVIEALIQESTHRAVAVDTRMAAAPVVPRLKAFDIGGKWDLKNSVYWAEGPSFNPRSGEIWAAQDWHKQANSVKLPDLQFVGCYGNGGEHPRWSRNSSKDKSKNQCTREAMENGHAYLMMEWSEGFKRGHAECATLARLPVSVEKYKVDDQECRSDEGELIGRSDPPPATLWPTLSCPVPRDTCLNTLGLLMVSHSLGPPSVLVVWCSRSGTSGGRSTSCHPALGRPRPRSR